MDYHISLITTMQNTVPPHHQNYPIKEPHHSMHYNELPQFQEMLNRDTHAYIMIDALGLIVQFPMDISVNDDFDGLKTGNSELHYYYLIQGNRYSTPFWLTIKQFMKDEPVVLQSTEIEYMVAQRIQYLQEEGYC